MSAADRLSAGERAAVRWGCRAAARINNERIRLGIALPAAVAAGTHHPPRRQVATMTNSTRLRGAPVVRRRLRRS